ncbi:YkgJ family cysteine cluster protein [Heliorestis convoluta]|uniref:YkgJ family cysteine cluster protein, putative n=1 Tax=Heliorestis convoluta TaxID=356322 RepID=A0A5Q2N2W4_9FIRM|nr:YkgJ family cysteine cluster protein [Heliorestis convoluta]QGG49338.1 YkgJ family cysteine cluster protein, putative [Heliorestis convoluta]
MDNKVILQSRPFSTGLGYDVVAYEPDATVADYERAVEDFFTQARWTVLRQSKQEQQGWDHCFGCPLCCSERIPLTIGDVVRLVSALPGKDEHNSFVRSRDLEEVLRTFAQIDCLGGAVDITLKRNEEGQCILFDKQRNCCRHHALRPLVCRTFFCSFLSHRAEKLRLRLINAGEDELVRINLRLNLLPDLLQEKVSIEDYPTTTWSAGYNLDQDKFSKDIESIVQLEPFTVSLGLVRLNR